MIIRFIPLCLITYYVLGIIGMEIFYESSQITATAAYGFYDEFSNFHSFIYTQFYMIQVLTEAGWSSVAFDYAKRS